MEYDVFISYRRKTSADDARLLQQALKARGYNVFFDYESLRDGVFDKRIFAAIEQAPVFILMLSEGSLNNCTNEEDWVRMEIEHALVLNRKIIPVAVFGHRKDQSIFKQALTKIFRKNQSGWFPPSLPKSIRPIMMLQVSELNKTALFEESVDTIIRNRFPDELQEKKSSKNKKDSFNHKKRKSEALSLGMCVTTHAMSMISKFPAVDTIQEDLKEWDLQDTVFSISDPMEVSSFLNEFMETFEKKWGKELVNCLYLGSLLLFCVVARNDEKSWAEWKMKTMLQCIKLQLPDTIIDKFNKDLSDDDIMLLKMEIMVALDQS